MKRKTNISVQDNRGIRVTPSIILGDKFEGYASGDLLDANAIKSLVYDDPSIGDKYYEKQKDILIEKDGIYQIKDNAVYPVAHPDLSTQPSILPQRFGNLDIKEVLIANGREDEIPSNAMILCAWSFNHRTCIPATCKKENGKWSFITENGFTPDFTLVRYVGADSGYYYGYGDEYGEEGHDEPIPNNIIVYRATEKLTEVTGSSNGGLHTNAFSGKDGQLTMTNHTFENGVGTIVFDDDVTSIGDWAFYLCTGLTSVTIPNTVTSIGNYAFDGCRGLISITIPNGVTSIEPYAFSGCSSLSNVTIPNSVTYIGDSAFNGCSSLSSIICNAATAPTITEYTFVEVKTGGTLTVPIGSTGYDVWMSTGDYYLGKYNWTKVENRRLIIYEATEKLAETTNVWTSGLHTNAFNTTIKSHTFNNGVGTIEFNSDVTSIGDYAFYHCSGLTSITIPDSVTSIGNSAFSWCTGLTSITIPNGVTSIEPYAFSGCRGLTSITIPNSVTSIGDYAFSYCSSLTSITIPNSVTSIGNYAFNGCSSLTSIEIPNSVTSIGTSAFDGCSSLTGITIPNSVTSIGDYAFQNCSNLTSIEIPNGVTSLGRSIFSGCSGLTSITIPNSVTSIGNYAFNGCSSLTNITCNATTAPTITSDTFINVKTNGTLTVPSGSTGYDVWMGTGDYYLGKYNWTKVEQ